MPTLNKIFKHKDIRNTEITGVSVLKTFIQIQHYELLKDAFVTLFIKKGNNLRKYSVKGLVPFYLLKKIGSYVWA